MTPHAPARFPCPACGASLRLRERRFIGATFPCPECGTSLTLLSLLNGEAAVQLAEAAASPQERPHKAAQSLPALSPTLIGWTIAAVAGCALLALAWPTDQSNEEIVAGPAPIIEPQPVPPQLRVITEAERPVAPVTPIDPPSARVTPVIVFDHAAEPPLSALTAIAEALVVPTVARPDAQAVLNQRLARFEQSRPVSRRDLLTMVEDLIGRPIAENDEAAATLRQPVSVSLTDGTVAELVEQILAGTDLQLAITPDAARLQRRAPTDAVTILLPR
jgi:hypothetical protein